MSCRRLNLLLGILILALFPGVLLATDVTTPQTKEVQVTSSPSPGTQQNNATAQLPAPSSLPPATTTQLPNKNSARSPKKVGVAVYSEILDQATSQPLTIQISLSKQRVYLMVGGKVAIDSPISSGKRKGWTPMGEFMILEKDPNHQSNLYGDFVDNAGRVVRSGVSGKIAIPNGAHFRGASMKFFMRLTPEGVGMHAGYLPGYPASHGCIRLPLEAAKLIYSKVAVNTPVTVAD